MTFTLDPTTISSLSGLLAPLAEGGIAGIPLGAIMGYLTKKVVKVVGAALKFISQVIALCFVAGFATAIALMGYFVSQGALSYNTQQGAALLSSIESSIASHAISTYQWASQVATTYGPQLYSWFSNMAQAAGPVLGAFGLSSVGAFVVTFKKA